MITELRSLWQEAFGDPEAFMDDFFSVAYDESRCRTVRKDGKTVSALYWFDVDMGTQRLAYLYGVATLNAYRGQGIAAYLIEKTCKELQEKGYSGVLLVPGSARLFEYYRRLSFFTCTTIAQCDCPAEGKTLLRPVSAEEYATLRRQLLPDRGVEQEGAFLELLQRQHGLFAGVFGGSAGAGCCCGWSGCENGPGADARTGAQLFHVSAFKRRCATPLLWSCNGLIYIVS